MEYTYPVEEYIARLKEYTELEAMTFSPEDSRERIVGMLEERSAKKRVIADVANTMIREYIETFEKEPEKLTCEDAEKLEEFANLLLPDKGRASNVEITDLGVYYRIAKILADFYKKRNDPDKYATELSRCSLGFEVLINAHAFTYQRSPYIEDSIALAGRLGEGVFGERAKTQALLTLARAAVIGEEQFPLDHLGFIKDTLNEQIKPPYKDGEARTLVYFYAMVLDYFREHCLWARDHGEEVDAEGARPFLHAVCDGLDGLREDAALIGMNETEICFRFLTTRFFLGDATLDETLDGIDELEKKSAESPNPLIQAMGLTEFGSFWLIAFNKYSSLPRDEIVRRSRERIKVILPKLTSMARMVNNVWFNRMIVMFLNAASLDGSFDEFADVILNATVYADKPLFIHTAMVREMSRAIFDRMIEDAPESFDGVAGRDTEYIKAHPDEMRDLLSECCLYHDIGKFFMLEIVGNSMRRLTDDEFGLIKTHPAHFENIYRMTGDEDERVRCIRDCALTHHVWHDGSRGYPNVPQTKNRPFADILAIADSIDAATDFLGRPYNSGKTIDQLIEEFRAGAGDHYGPDAVAALSCPEVRDKLNYLITEGRRDIYYRIYAFNKL